MDWTNVMTALIPGVEGTVLRGLHAVTGPQTVTDLHRRAPTGSRNGIRDALHRLARQGVVLETRVGNVDQYRLNPDHVAFPALDSALRAFDPYRLLRERLAEIVTDLFPASGPGGSLSLAIYGSVARREAFPDSDIDILLVHPDDIERDDPRLLNLLEALHRLVPLWTGNPAHILVLARSELSASHQEGDPLSRSLEADADTVTGPDVRALMIRKAA